MCVRGGLRHRLGAVWGVWGAGFVLCSCLFHVCGRALSLCVRAPHMCDRALRICCVCVEFVQFVFVQCVCLRFGFWRPHL